MFSEKMAHYLNVLTVSSGVKVTNVPIDNQNPNQMSMRKVFPLILGTSLNDKKLSFAVNDIPKNNYGKLQFEIPQSIPPKKEVLRFDSFNTQVKGKFSSPGKKNDGIPLMTASQNIPTMPLVIKNTKNINGHKENIQRKNISLVLNKKSSNSSKHDDNVKKHTIKLDTGKRRRRISSISKDLNFALPNISPMKKDFSIDQNRIYDYEHMKNDSHRSPTHSPSNYSRFPRCKKKTRRCKSPGKHEKIRFTDTEKVTQLCDIIEKTSDQPTVVKNKKIIINIDECNDFSTFMDIPLCDVEFVSYATNVKKVQSVNLQTKSTETQSVDLLKTCDNIEPMNLASNDVKAEYLDIGSKIDKIQSMDLYTKDAKTASEDVCDEHFKNVSTELGDSNKDISSAFIDLIARFEETIWKRECKTETVEPEYIEYVLYEDDNYLEQPARELFSKIMFLKIIPVMEKFANDYNIESVLSYLNSIDLTGHRAFVVKELVVWALEQRELYLVYFGHLLIWLIASGLIRRTEVVHGLSQCFVNMNDKWPNYSKDVSRFIICVMPLLLSNYLELSDFMFIIKSRSESMLLDCIIRLFDILADMTCFRTLRDVFLNPEMNYDFKLKIMEKYPSLKAIPKIPSLYISFDVQTIFKFNINGDLYPSQFDSEAIYKDYMKEFFNLLHFTCPMGPHKAVEIHISNVVTEHVDFLRCLLNSYNRLLKFYDFMHLTLIRRFDLPQHFARFLTSALVKNNLCMSSLPESILVDTNFDVVPFSVYTELP